MAVRQLNQVPDVLIEHNNLAGVSHESAFIGNAYGNTSSLICTSQVCWSAIAIHWGNEYFI